MKISRTIWILLRALSNNRSYFEALEVKAEKMAKKYDCAFVAESRRGIR